MKEEEEKLNSVLVTIPHEVRLDEEKAKIYKEKLLHRELLNAIASQNTQSVVQVINNGANVNLNCHKHDFNAFTLAITTGNVEILEELLRQGVSESTKALHLAVACGSSESVKFLIGQWKRVVDLVDAKTPAGKFSPRGEKCQLNKNCKKFIGSIPKIPDGFTPLHVAAFYCHAELVDFLLGLGADPRALNDQGFTPLEIVGACIYRNQGLSDANDGFCGKFERCFESLLAKFDPERDEYYSDLGRVHNTCLHVAIRVKSVLVLKKIIKSPALNSTFLELLDENGQTALHLAVKGGDESILMELLNQQFPLDLKNRNGNTSLFDAISNKWRFAIETLIQLGSNLTDLDRDGNNVLHCLVDKNMCISLRQILIIKIVRQLVGNCGNILQVAVRNGCKRCLKTLLESGASFDFKGDSESFYYNLVASCVAYGAMDCLTFILKQTNMVVFVKKNLTEAVKLALGMDKREYFEALLGFRYVDHKILKDVLVEVCTRNKYKELEWILTKMNDEGLIEKAIADGYDLIKLAAHAGSSECIKLLITYDRVELTSRGLGEGAKHRETVLSIIQRSVPGSKELLESVFDEQIRFSRPKNYDKSHHLNIHFDFAILIDQKGDQMDVIKAIAGTSYDRYRGDMLLLHPLVQTFLYLKWKRNAKRIRMLNIISFCLTAFYVASLIGVAIALYSNAGQILLPWKISFSISIIMLTLESSYKIVRSCWIPSKELKINGKSESTSERVTKSILADLIQLIFILLGIIILHQTDKNPEQNAYLRHLICLTFLASFYRLVYVIGPMLFSSLPPRCSEHLSWFGIYTLMFRKVVRNVLTVLAIFFLFLFSFALAFLIEFEASIPFNSIWQSLVKIMVMLTSEFDYSNFPIHNVDSKDRVGIQIVVFVFVVLVIISLMNLMIALSVSRIDQIEKDAQLELLKRQACYLIELRADLKPIGYLFVTKENDIEFNGTRLPASLEKEILNFVEKNRRKMQIIENR